MESKVNQNISPNVEGNDLGYFQLSKMPSKEDLSEYYREKYYQQQLRTHRTEYSEEEIKYRRNKLEQKHHVFKALTQEPSSKEMSFLDIGAGEGFAMKYFHDLGWNVLGIDHSSHACKTHHPDLISKYLIGDIGDSVFQLQQSGKKFKLILLDNVLEHMLSPAEVLGSVRELLDKDGVLVIEVPNDFSLFQNHLLDKRKIPSAFWVVEPDHISYFNRRGLSNLLESQGFTEHEVIGDFPIDAFLFNPHTNYITNKEVGPSCHQARIEIENLIHAESIERTIELLKRLADLGIGRQITGFYKVTGS